MGNIWRLFRHGKLSWIFQIPNTFDLLIKYIPEKWFETLNSTKLFKLEDLIITGAIPSDIKYLSDKYTLPINLDIIFSKFSLSELKTVFPLTTDNIKQYLKYNSLKDIVDNFTLDTVLNCFNQLRQNYKESKSLTGGLKERVIPLKLNLEALIKECNAPASKLKPVCTLTELCQYYSLKDLKTAYTDNELLDLDILNLGLFSEDEILQNIPIEKSELENKLKILDYEPLSKEITPNFDETSTVKKTLPKSLQNFPKHLEEHLRGLTLFKIREVQNKCEKTIRKMLINEPFHMRISAENLFKVLKDGRFKNFLETDTSGGFADIEGRIENTKKLFGADTDKMEAKDHPKFGYLGTMSPSCDIYGDVIITFKKENLWHTTTFSAHDSIIYEDHLIPSFVSEPKLCSFDWKDDRLKLPYALDIYNKQGFNAFREMLNTSYIELQYHEDVLTSDIEKIEFTNSVYSPLKENLEIKLQELHIPYIMI